MSDKDNDGELRLIICLILSAAYFFAIFYFLGLSIEKIKTMKPNEIGDFFAGVFSPLAFFFLIVGYIQNTQALRIQSKELKASTEALELQVAEMKDSVDQQKILVEIQNNEIEAKHFSAKPFLTFKVHDFHKYHEPHDITDENDEYIETIQRKFCEFELTLENKGELSKQISFINPDNTFSWQLYELGKNYKADKTIQLDDDEIDQLDSNKYFSKKFIVQYFDQYGKEYKTNIQYEIKYYHPENEFYVSFKETA
ncbi:hypothetical protein FR838_18430 [Acinetobacter pittii]|uniref:hypothetical protein n=1 Tax=Acinetobacter pittii TaxID=48296 RepID=UPI0011BB1708|nr:hypothetical protein [Acinetobacter pittii]QEA26366.1 hypothetical protein FR838_18430 [Acinetobacter pittii]